MVREGQAGTDVLGSGQGTTGQGSIRAPEESKNGIQAVGVADGMQAAWMASGWWLACMQLHNPAHQS